MLKFKRFLKSWLVSFFVLSLLTPYVSDLITVETAQATFTLTVQVTGLSPTQAVLTYTAPDTNPCTIEVSQSSGYSPLVHDVDPTLFSGADSDSRSSSVTSDTQRIFVVGTRTIQLAQDGRKYSRALQQNTTHYYRVTCGSAVATGSFTTKILPFGATYQDLLPTNADGTYNYPDTSTTDRNEEIVDSQTGVLLKRVNLPSDDVLGDAPVVGAAGFDDYCYQTPPDSNGFYHCGLPDHTGIFPYLYAVQPTTGEVRFLGHPWVWRHDAHSNENGATAVGEGYNFIYKNENITTPYAATFKWTYTGNDDPANNIPDYLGNPVMRSPGVISETDENQNILEQIYAFAPEIDPTRFSCGANGGGGNYLYLRCDRGIQDSYSWLVAYDIQQKKVVSAIKVWAVPGSRWCGVHTVENLGNYPYMSFEGNSLFHNGVGEGPYATTLSSDMQASSTYLGLDTIHVTSTWDPSWGAQPSDFADGELTSTYPDHFLQTVQPGDVFFIGSSPTETIQLVTKISSNTWVVRRGLNHQGTDAGEGPHFHPSGSSITSECNSGGYIHWDFIASPDASNLSDYVADFGSHPVQRGLWRVDTEGKYRYGDINDHSTWGQPITGGISQDLSFAGHGGAGSGNTYQRHPSMSTGNPENTFYDETYFVGGQGFSSNDGTAVTSLGGSLYQYHEQVGNFAGEGMGRKYLPTLAKTRGQALVDISGPGAILPSDASGNYQYCIANAAGECHAGSQKGDEFFNLPGLDVPYCSGGENPTALHDICLGNFDALGVAAVQFKLVNNYYDTVGRNVRPLTRTFANYDKMMNTVKPTYNGEWLLYFVADSLDYYHPVFRVFAVKVPPVAGSDDGIDRTTFVPSTLSITPPSGQGITAARVKFGYAEQGDPTNYYCTSRREQCVATNSSVDINNPFSYALTDSYTPTPCTSSCTVTLPIYPLHTAYYQVEYLNNAGQIVSLGDQGVSIENHAVGIASVGDVTPPIISSVTSSSITSSSANVSWTTDKTSDSQVEYGLDTNYGSSTSLNSSLVTSHTVSVAGLTGSTLYHYRVKSRDSLGNLSISTDQTFTTSIGSDVTPPVLSSISATSIASTTAAISWTTNELSDSQVAYGLTSSLGSNTSLNTSLVLNHGVSLSGLTPNTAYYYRALSKDASTNLGSSTIQSFNTLPSNAPPDTTAPVISSVAYSNLAQTTATISWITDESSDSQVEYGTTASLGSSSSLDSSLVTSHSVNLSSLSPSTTYYYRVDSKDASSNLATSTIQTFATTAQSSGGGGGGGGGGGYITPTPTPTPAPGKTKPAPATGTNPAIKLINNKGTIFLIQNGQRQGVTNLAMLKTYGLTVSQATPATPQDLSTPQGPILPPADGSLVKSKEDQTVYLISNRQRYAFASSKVFTSLGFKFSNVLVVTNPELQSLPKRTDLSTTNTTHLPGMDISKNGVIYWFGYDNKLYPYPDLTTYNSWHVPNDFSNVVPANTKDLSLPIGEYVKMRVVR